MKFILLTIVIALSHIKANPPKPEVKDTDSRMKVFLFYPNHGNKLMQTFSSKTLILSDNEAVVYSSNNKTPNADKLLTTQNYLFTLLYHQVDLPCLNRSYVCTLKQLQKEHKSVYSEINFNIPQALKPENSFIKHPLTQCLILTFNPFLTLDDTLWICTNDLNTLSELQLELSMKIRESYMKDLEFYTDFFPADRYSNNISKNTSTPGLLQLQSEGIKFIKSTKEEVLHIKYTKIKPFAYPYYMREEFPIKEDDLDNKCFKFILEEQESVTKTFCVLYGRGDFTRKRPLNSVEARWAAEFTVQKLNHRLLEAHLSENLGKIANIKDSLEVEGSLILPAKIKARQEYLFYRHKAIVEEKYKPINDSELNKKLSDILEHKIAEACNSIDLCIRTLKYEKENGFMPLKEAREKLAMDITNPYLPISPSMHIKIDEAKKSFGQELIKKIDKIKGAEDFMAEEANFQLGEFPSFKEIGMAFDIFNQVKEAGKDYSTVKDIKGKCKNSDDSLIRKIGLFEYFTPTDNFFDFLGSISHKIQNVRSE